jgi:SAM-dependent methyltransferase
MDDREAISRKMREHYERVWRGGDAWEFERSGFEQARYGRQAELLADRRYGRALEIGCGSGCFTRRLAGLAERVVALDIAEAAVERARAQTAGAGPGRVELKVADAMAYDLGSEGPWDLVVLSEAVYCLGWLYPFFDVAWFAARLFGATREGGRLLLANTYGQEGMDWLQRPWLVHTYRDLFRNVGYRLEHEEVFRGTKEGVDFRVLASLMGRPEGGGSDPGVEPLRPVLRGEAFPPPFQDERPGQAEGGEESRGPHRR